MEAKPSILLNVMRDTLVLGGVLAVLNYFLAKEDPGWFSLNPMPWLLLPLLIGARYGVVSGTVVGALCAVAMTVIRARIEDITPQMFATEHPYPLTALVFAGFMAGELRQILRGCDQQLHVENARLLNHVDRLGAELQLVRQTRHDLQRHLALHNAPLTGLDEDLGKLALLPAAQVFDSLLQVLGRVAEVVSAGIYEQRGQTLHRMAVMNATPPLTAAIPVQASPLTSRALAEDSIAAFAEPLSSQRAEPFLCAIPWREGGRRGVLLIQDMPLRACDWQNYSRIELVLHWTLRVREHVHGLRQEATAATHGASLEEFLMLVAQLLETEQTHGLPSTILCVATDAGRVPDAALKTLPAASITTRLPVGDIACLLPFTGVNDAREIMAKMNRAAQGLQMAQHLVAGPAKAQDLWARIVGK
jgi:hypothetical protein